MRISTHFLAKTSFILSPRKDSAFESLNADEINRLFSLFPRRDMRVAIQEELKVSYGKT